MLEFSSTVLATLSPYITGRDAKHNFTLLIALQLVK